MNAANPAQPIARPRQSMRWPMIIVGLLLSHIVLMMTAVFVITRDNHDRIISDYYQKSLHWDQTHAPPGPRRTP